MAQASVVNYFNNRKRSAVVDESKINRAKKVLVLDGDNPKTAVGDLLKSCVGSIKQSSNSIKKENDMILKVVTGFEIGKLNSPSSTGKKKPLSVKVKKPKAVMKMGNIEQLLNNMTKNKIAETLTVAPSESTEIVKAISTVEANTSTKITDANITKPSTPTKQLNAMDKVSVASTNSTSLVDLTQKLSRSSRLAKLKASLARFKQSEKQLEVAEQKTKQVSDLCTLKNCKAVELEINLSPQKPQSPQKAYLSPKKDTGGARKNLFGLLSPSKTAKSITENLVTVKESLALPYKYRCLAEKFRAIDTVCQILYNRKETITFRKVKPAVEEMLKRNLTEKHLGQIKSVYSESFSFQWEKLRSFGSGSRHEQWELVLVPQAEQSTMTAEHLLDRRRKFYKVLIEKLKDLHQEFLMTLDPPIEISREKITRWHPQFDIEKVPDIEASALPSAPDEEKFTTGTEVLEKARAMFNCNTRMERALLKLKESQGTQVAQPVMEGSVLKGIPKALLEKVRQRQSAKALESMTRSSVKEKEVQLYLQLPEVARLTRNLFVSEKKSVLRLELVVDKLCNSYRVFSNKKDMEGYLKTIAKEIKGWLVFHEIRGDAFIKLAKDTDLSLVVNKLKTLAEQKSNFN